MSEEQDNKEADASRGWGAFRAKRTQAIPAATLSGSCLEMKSDKQLEETKDVDVKPVSFKSQGGKRIFTKEKFFLPESIELLNRQKQALAQQHQEAIEAKKAADATEEKRKHFAENIEQQQAPKRLDSQRGGKFTRSDLENALIMNNVGYNKGRSYNRQKYMPKPPQHQYALIGNVLQTGGELALDLNDYKRHPEEAYITRPMGRNRKPLPSISPNNDRSSPEVLSASDLPENIRHSFGTTVCTSALANPDLVRASLEESKKSKRQRKPSLQTLRTNDLADNKMDPNYQAIGLSTRQNLFPGYTYDHKISHSKSVFSPDVHNQRQRDPDQWRHCRDELGIWNEFNTLNNKLHKRWEEYEENQPKLQPNWDRDAKRLPKPQQVPLPPPKPKKKPPPKKLDDKAKNVENDLVFEDIEFKTPPLSPPYKPPPKDLIPAFEQDDDFWDFYNQALPLP